MWTRSTGTRLSSAATRPNGSPVGGRWSATFVAAISAAYAVVMVVGFASLGNLSDPLPDPYLAVAEILILVMAPVMVVLMAAVHACAPARLRMFSLIAFGWMLVAACLTMTVHVVQLVMVRRIEPESVPGFAAVRLRVACLVGPVGPAIDVMAWRGIGIRGYVVAFPIACIALSRAFADAPAHEDTRQCAASTSARNARTAAR